jgi:hypothetical protein
MRPPHADAQHMINATCFDCQHSANTTKSRPLHIHLGHVMRPLLHVGCNKSRGWGEIALFLSGKCDQSHNWIGNDLRS